MVVEGVCGRDDTKPLGQGLAWDKNSVWSDIVTGWGLSAWDSFSGGRQDLARLTVQSPASTSRVFWPTLGLSTPLSPAPDPQPHMLKRTDTLW